MSPLSSKYPRRGRHLSFTPSLMGRDYREGRTASEVSLLAAGALLDALREYITPLDVRGIRVLARERELFEPLADEFIVVVWCDDIELLPEIVLATQMNLAPVNAEWEALDSSTGKRCFYYAYRVLGAYSPDISVTDDAPQHREQQEKAERCERSAQSTTN